MIHFNGHLYIFGLLARVSSQDIWNLVKSSGSNILLVFYFTFQL